MNEFPAVEHLLQSDELFNGSTVVVSSIVTSHSLFPGRVVFSIAISIGRQGAGLDGVNGNVIGRGKGQEIWKNQCINSSCCSIV